MESTGFGSTERKRNNYIISRSGKFKSKNKKRIQITDEFWIDPVQSSTKPIQQPSATQDVYREIKDLHQQHHSKSDNGDAHLMRMFQNFTTSSSSAASSNNIVNNFIKSDNKKLSTSDKQRDTASQKQSNEIRLPS